MWDGCCVRADAASTQAGGPVEIAIANFLFFALICEYLNLDFALICIFLNLIWCALSIRGGLRLLRRWMDVESSGKCKIGPNLMSTGGKKREIYPKWLMEGEKCKICSNLLSTGAKNSKFVQKCFWWGRKCQICPNLLLIGTRNAKFVKIWSQWGMRYA